MTATTQEIQWNMMSILNWTKEYLASKGVENARLEAEWLLAAATGLDRMGLYLNYDKPLNEVERSRYRAMVARRGQREPLQHILGTQEFHGLDFQVSSHVLIPRPETELLVSEALIHLPDNGTFLDVGTGSGCIAISVAKQRPDASVMAVDISQEALAVARQNAGHHQVTIEFIHGSLFTPVASRSFDVIVSNPPYIPTGDIAFLQPEVRDWDPALALDGGVDGLTIYRKLIPASVFHLNQGGWLIVEVGASQADDVISLFTASSFSDLFTTCDHAGIPRIVGGCHRAAE